MFQNQKLFKEEKGLSDDTFGPIINLSFNQTLYRQLAFGRHLANAGKLDGCDGCLKLSKLSIYLDN